MKTINAAVAVGGAVCSLFLAGSAVDAQNLFVGDYSAGELLEYSGGVESVFATGLNYPTGLAFDSSGDLFEGDQFSGNIYEWKGGGATRTTFATGLSQPGPMAINAAGDLFVVVNGSIDEFSPAGTVINTITDLQSTERLAFDTQGNLYVANIAGGTIVKITPSGVQSTFASGLDSPNGLAFNAVGDLFVSSGNADGSTITEITPGGSESLFASGLDSPATLAFDKSGDLFAAEEGGYDILEFAANGTKSVFASGYNPTSLAFQGEILPVPEPSAYALFGIGLVAALVRFYKNAKIA
jgi:DNA-binding beta-propeller fold protein YncE